MITIINKERESNFELLRIVAMVLIVLHHFSVHSNFVYETSVWSFNHLFIQFIYFGGKVGVDCFVLISGYFLIMQRFKLKKWFAYYVLCGFIVLLFCCIVKVCI